MRVNWKMVLSVAGMTALGLQVAMLPTQAQNKQTGYLQRNYRKPVTFKQYLSDHPKIKSATVGAGVGTAAGAVTGLVSGRGVLRGAAVGAGTGAGVGLIRSSNVLSRHPIVRDLATGAAVGGGLGWAGGRTGGTVGKSAAVGGAVGLGIGMLKHL